MSLLSNTAIKKILSQTQTWTASQNYEDDAKLLFGESSGDLEIYHDGNDSYIKDDGTGELYIQASSIYLQELDGGVADTYFEISVENNKSTFLKDVHIDADKELLFGTNEEGKITYGTNLDISSTSGIALDGNVSFTGDLTFSNATPNILFSSGNDVSFQSNAGYRFRLDLNDNGDNNFTIADGGNTSILSLSESGNLHLNKNYSSGNGELRIGTGNQLRLLYNGSDSVIQSDSGDLYITTNVADKDIVFRTDGLTEYLRLDGSANNIPVSKAIRMKDSVSLAFGDEDDVRMYFNGTTFIFDLDQVSQVPLNMDVGDFNIDTHGRFFIRDADDGDVVLFDFDTGTRTFTIGEDDDGNSSYDMVSTVFNGNVDIQVPVSANLELISTAGVGSPAQTTYIKMRSEHGGVRGQGIFYEDVGATNEQWYTGLPYSASFNIWQVGFDSDTTTGESSNYQSNGMFKVYSSGDTETAGRILIPHDGTTSANYVGVGEGNDFKMYHTGAISYLYNTSGTVEIQSTTGDEMVFNQTNTSNTYKNYIFKNIPDGASRETNIKLVANQLSGGTANIDTTLLLGIHSTDSTVYGYLSAPTNGSTSLVNTMRFYSSVTAFEQSSRHADNKPAYFGTAYDSQIKWDETNMVIRSDSSIEVYLDDDQSVNPNASYFGMYDGDNNNIFKMNESGHLQLGLNTTSPQISLGSNGEYNAVILIGGDLNGNNAGTRTFTMGVDYSDNLFRLNAGSTFDGTFNGLKMNSSGNVSFSDVTNFEGVTTNSTVETARENVANYPIQVPYLYVDNEYIPLLTAYSTDTPNTDKSKVGIYARNTSSGTYLYLGTSRSYSTGVNKVVTITNEGGLLVNDEILLTADSDDDAGTGAKLGIGANSDLKLYHDGTNSYINNATGSLLMGDFRAIAVRDETVGGSGITAVNDYYWNGSSWSTSSSSTALTLTTHYGTSVVNTTATGQDQINSMVQHHTQYQANFDNITVEFTNAVGLNSVTYSLYVYVRFAGADVLVNSFTSQSLSTDVNGATVTRSHTIGNYSWAGAGMTEDAKVKVRLNVTAITDGDITVDAVDVDVEGRLRIA